MPLPLTEEEEALLVFAASGVTGYAFARPVLCAGGGRSDRGAIHSAGQSPAAMPSRPSL